ncbi:MAG: hypothetical protein QSU88_09280 [Candidatus Methanoperedens sp.]|nr:hypothetical protein [Candidatus Methanoperedens sp.]
MARFVKGDVVVVPFPFSDLSQSKRRPALVIAVRIDNKDFDEGSLNQRSPINFGNL